MDKERNEWGGSFSRKRRRDYVAVSRPDDVTFWQGCQISPLFHEDDQDGQAINLTILLGCGDSGGGEAIIGGGLPNKSAQKAR
jgi:hypothetical protein